MMPYDLVFLDRKCLECGNAVTQIVFFKLTGDRIEILTYWRNCLVCQALLPEPTEEEIRESP